MDEILRFMAGIITLIQQEYDFSDPERIGIKTSEYIEKFFNTQWHSGTDGKSRKD
jgi:hypothetical protein